MFEIQNLKKKKSCSSTLILFVGHSQQRGVLRQFLSRCSANTNTKTLLFCWKTFAVSSLCEIPQRCSVGFNSGKYSHVKVFRFLFTSCVLVFFGSVFWIIMMLEYFSPGKPLEPGSCVVISTGIHGIIYKCHLPKTFCTHAYKPHIVRPQPPPITVGTVFTVAVLARLIKNAGLYLNQTNLSYEFIWFEIRMCFQYSSGFFS